MSAAKLMKSDNNGPDEVMVRMGDVKVLKDQFQTRDGLNMKIVDIYAKRMKEGASFPAVLVFRLPDGRMILADGFHRHAAAKAIRRDKIKAVVLEGTEEDAILAGLKANKEIVDERSLTANDKAHAVRLMIRNKTFNGWSDRAIGNLCGCREGLPARLRVEMRESEGIAIPEMIMTFNVDGSPRGIRRYRSTHNAVGDIRKSKVAKGRGNDRNISRINGKITYLSTDNAAANAQREAVVACQDSWKTTLGLDGTKHIRERLMRKGVMCRPSEMRPTATFVFARNLVVGIPEIGLENVYEAIGRLSIASVKESDINRLIILGYVNRNGTLGEIMSAASQAGYEFMTPEELIAEFAPKDSEGHAAPEPHNA